jgi:hypothetical protein
MVEPFAVPSGTAIAKASPSCHNLCDEVFNDAIEGFFNYVNRRSKKIINKLIDLI